MGLTLYETMTLPLSLLYDMIAINQIKKEGYKYKQSDSEGLTELIHMYNTLK